MKVFVALLLVASAAAGPMGLLKENSLSHHNQWERKSILGDYYPRTTVEDVPSEYGYDYPSTYGPYEQRKVMILSFEELISTPLFREYYNIPLFRQFLEQYPVVFRRYLESVLFQQFYQSYDFQQYFRNPVLFYKYIYPQIQVVARTHHSVSPYTGDYNKVYDYEQYLNKNLYPVGREVIVGDYLNKIFSGLHHQGQYESMPFTYARYGSVYGNKNTIYNPVNYKFLLDKIYRTLFVNQPTVGEVTQVRTDVKVAPEHKVVVVEPITGESKVVVEEPKIVDVKVQEKVVPRTEVGTTEFQGEHKMIKEVLLKKLLIHKVITPEMYEVLETLPLYEIEQLIRERQGIFRDFVDTPFVTRREILRELEPFTTRGIYGQVETPFITRRDQYYGQRVHTPFWGQHVQTPFWGQRVQTPFWGQRVQTPFWGQQYNRHYNNEIVGDRVVPVVPEYLNTVYGQRHIVPTFVRV